MHHAIGSIPFAGLIDHPSECIIPTALGSVGRCPGNGMCLVTPGAWLLNFAGSASSIHVIVLAILIICWWRWRWLLLYQYLSIEWACWVELQPGLYTFQIEEVILVAWQTDYQRVRV